LCPGLLLRIWLCLLGAWRRLRRPRLRLRLNPWLRLRLRLCAPVRFPLPLRLCGRPRPRLRLLRQCAGLRLRLCLFVPALVPSLLGWRGLRMWLRLGMWRSRWPLALILPVLLALFLLSLLPFRQFIRSPERQ
jgi:hypothetical protein